MSSRRPILITTDESGLGYRATYFRIFEATASVRRLIHGKLRDNGNYCAVGCYFKNTDIPINSEAIEEISSYNDSFPNLSMYERWKKVRKWLRYEVRRLGKRNP